MMITFFKGFKFRGFIFSWHTYSHHFYSYMSVIFVDNAKSKHLIPQKFNSHENYQPYSNKLQVIGTRQLPYCHDLVFVEKMQ